MSRKSGRNKKGGSVATRPVQQKVKSSFTATAAFSPGVPPQPSILFGSDPRNWQYTPGTNLISYPRSSEPNSFQTLRDLAMAYDVVQMCEQVWFDIIRGLQPSVVPEAELLDDGEDTGKYQADIAYYEQLFAKPDGVTPVLDMLCAAVKDRLELGAMAFYPRKTRGGGFFALELIDSSTIKPLTDVYGRIPQAPLPAYEQYLYGTPAGLYTTDDILYLPENRRTNSSYAISRVEMFLTRINQALRKQSRDMARFTNGNLPDGIIELPSEVTQGWTPKDLADFREQWNAMYAGNDAARAGARIGLPGTKYTKIDDEPISTDFDIFALTIGCACFGVTKADMSFTDTLNKATAESQLAITYNRTVRPTVHTIEELFTYIIQNVIGDKRFRYKLKGYEAADDFAANAASHVTLVTSGIEAASDAAKALKIPNKIDLPRFIVTREGPFVVDNLANPDVNAKLLDTILNPPQPIAPKPPEQGNVTDENASQQGDKNTQDGKQAPATNGKQDASKGQGKAQPTVKRDDAVVAPVHTGMMLAFMLDPATATALALPDGEPINQLHVTLAFLGDSSEFAGNLDHLKTTVANFAQQAAPLEGRVSGVGRFTPSELSDGLSPVYASVDVKGLHAFRDKLVEYLAGMGYAVANDFAYTPHITLAYIPVDAPMPVTEVPTVTLQLATVTLAVGDEHTSFPLSKAASESLQRATSGTPPIWEPDDIEQHLTALKALGVLSQTWHSDPGACDPCLSNDGVTVPLGQPFPSGHRAPKAHPHCDCTASYTYSNKERTV